jgi:hypothetical protein
MMLSRFEVAIFSHSLSFRGCNSSIDTRDYLQVSPSIS